MLIGYARVSTQDQNLDLQLDALFKAGCSTDKTYKDTISSAKELRPELEKALDQLRTGDTLVVWRLDRLGRSLQELITLVDGIRAQGADFKSLSENIDTTTQAASLSSTSSLPWPSTSVALSVNAPKPACKPPEPGQVRRQTNDSIARPPKSGARQKTLRRADHAGAGDLRHAPYREKHAVS